MGTLKLYCYQKNFDLFALLGSRDAKTLAASSRAQPAAWSNFHNLIFIWGSPPIPELLVSGRLAFN